MEKSRKPKIRFKGFTDDWEQRKLVELLTKYTDEVNVPHNGYERLGIRSHAKGTFHSYVSEGHELQTGKMHKVAADKFIVNITFGWEHAVAVTDKNDAGKLVSHRFPQYSLSENLYSKFFKYIILDDKFKHHLWLSSPGGAGRNRVLKLDEMLEYKIKIPNVQEQQKIAEVLMDLDHLIILHQRKLDKLVNVKKSMLEKMFPQQGSRIPEIRFCGFTDDWEQRKLVELLTKYTDEVNVPHNGYERLGIRSHAKGTFHSYVSEGHELQTGKMHKVAADKFIVNITFGWEHAVAVTDKNDAGKLVSHRFPQYSLSENLYSKFFKYIILDDKFKHHLWLSSPGGAGRNRVLKLDEMLEYKIKIPNVQEQQKIAEVLMDLDHLIILHQRKLDKLVNVKKSMLEKMFPQQGSRIPEIRFCGFTDDWEQRELGNIGQTYTGLSGKTKDDFGHGHAQFVTYMNVFSNPICNPKMNEPIEVDSKQNEVEVGDVFFTTSSETPKEVGMTSVLIEKQGKMYLNSFCFGYRLYEKYDSYYLAYMLRSNSFREKIIMLAQGISRYNISKNKVMEIDVFVPSYKEQMEIGKYFRDLDTLITLHQRKLEKLKNIKKSMLEKMFI